MLHNVALNPDGPTHGFGHKNQLSCKYSVKCQNSGQGMETTVLDINLLNLKAKKGWFWG